MGNCAGSIAAEEGEAMLGPGTRIGAAHAKGGSGSLRESYKVQGQVLGFGRMASVREGVELSTGRHVAVKACSKKLLSARPARISRVSHPTPHPHIVNLLATFEDRQHLYLVLELVSGGALFHHIAGRDSLSEGDVRTIVHQLLQAISHCHSRGVVHRDLKPENIMLQGPSEKGGGAAKGGSPSMSIKLVDFGSAAILGRHSQRQGQVEGQGQGQGEGQREGQGEGQGEGGGGEQPLADFMGTAFYAAPEVWAQRYGRESDLFSVGAILFVLLTGRVPSPGLTRATARGDPTWQQLQQGRAPDLPPGVSQPARDLLRALLDPDPAQRATAEGALAHPWFTGEAPGAEALEGSIRGIRTYATLQKLKKAVFSLIIIFLNEDQMASLVASLDATAHGAHLTAHSGAPGWGTHAGAPPGAPGMPAGVPEGAPAVAGPPGLGFLEQQLSVRAVMELLEAQGMGHVASQVYETALAMAGPHRGGGALGALAEAGAVTGAAAGAGVGGGGRGGLGPLGNEPLFSEGELGMLLVRHNRTLSQVRRQGRRQYLGSRTGSNNSRALSPASLRPNGTVWYTRGEEGEEEWRAGLLSWQQLKKAGSNFGRNLSSLKSTDSLQSLSPKAAKLLSRKPPGTTGIARLHSETKPQSVTKSRSAAPRMFQTRSSVELRQLAPDRTPGSDASFHQAGESPGAAAGSSFRSGAHFRPGPSPGAGGGKLSGGRSESATKHSSSVHGERLYQAAFLKLGSES